MFYDKEIKTIHMVVGARPNFMKIAPLYHTFQKEEAIVPLIIHTGQHYDFDMSDTFFEDLHLPEPYLYLGISGGTHAEQTGKIMIAYEKALIEEKPDLVVVVGDVNSTMACAIAAKKLNIKIAHIEAGLRSQDLTMPEEINRIITDSIADYLFVTEQSGAENLEKEGRKNIFMVGDVMIDVLLDQLNKLGVSRRCDPYSIVTLHRPSNVDDKGVLKGILEALSEIADDMPVIFPVHPRTKINIKKWGLSSINSIQFTAPKSYTDFLNLWRNASLVITDSGGLQGETTVLGVPCFTVRKNTEKPITISKGTNTLVGTTKESILAAYEDFKKYGPKDWSVPELWDGRTTNRIVQIIKGLI